MAQCCRASETLNRLFNANLNPLHASHTPHAFPDRPGPARSGRTVEPYDEDARLAELGTARAWRDLSGWARALLGGGSFDSNSVNATF